MAPSRADSLAVQKFVVLERSQGELAYHWIAQARDGNGTLRAEAICASGRRGAPHHHRTSERGAGDVVQDADAEARLERSAGDGSVMRRTPPLEAEEEAWADLAVERRPTEAVVMGRAPRRPPIGSAWLMAQLAADEG